MFYFHYLQPDAKEFGKGQNDSIEGRWPVRLGADLWGCFQTCSSHESRGDADGQNSCLKGAIHLSECVSNPRRRSFSPSGRCLAVNMAAELHLEQISGCMLEEVQSGGDGQEALWRSDPTRRP